MIREKLQVVLVVLLLLLLLKIGCWGDVLLFKSSSLLP